MSSFLPRTKNPRALCSAVVVIALFALVAGPAVADNVTNLAKRLSALRAEVEQLSNEVAQKTEEMNSQLRSLGRQKGDLQLELKREQTRVQKLSVAIRKRKDEIRAEKEKGDRLVPLFKKTVHDVRGHVRSTLPFKTTERLAAVDKIAEQYRAGLLPPARALMRLWSFLEDEFRLTRESGLYRQTVSVGGEEQLVDVARIGMVMLYFKSADDLRVGRAVKKDGKWGFEYITAPKDQENVFRLFDSFQKQIRSGFFQLPNTLQVAK